MSRLLWQWLLDDEGQDLIEYALLGSTIGFAGYVAATAVTTFMNTTYASWDGAVQSDGLVEMPDPKPAQ